MLCPYAQTGTVEPPVRLRRVKSVQKVRVYRADQSTNNPCSLGVILSLFFIPCNAKKVNRIGQQTAQNKNQTLFLISVVELVKTKREVAMSYTKTYARIYKFRKCVVRMRIYI